MCLLGSTVRFIGKTIQNEEALSAIYKTRLVEHSVEVKASAS